MIILEKCLLLTLAYASFVRLASGHEKGRKEIPVESPSCLCFHACASRAYAYI